MPVNVPALRAFHAVATGGGFSAGAQLLGRTQSTVTIMIDRLEKQYGVELIVRRRGKFVGLTSAGESVMRSASQMFQHENDIELALRNSSGCVSGRLCLGSTAPRAMIRIVTRLRETFPALEISISQANSARVVGDLLDCRTDLGIAGGYVNEADLIAIPHERREILLVGTQAHIPTDGMTLSQTEFSSKTLLLREPGSQTRTAVLGHLEHHAMQPAGILEITTREAQAYAAAAGLGVAPIADAEVPEGLNLNRARLEGGRIEGSVSLYLLRSRAASPLLKRVLEVAQTLRCL